MSVMDKLINAMKFNDDPYDEENETEDSPYYDEEPEKEDPVFDKEDEDMAEMDNNAAGRGPRRRNVPERAMGRDLWLAAPSKPIWEHDQIKDYFKQ